MAQEPMKWDGAEPYRCIAMDPPWPERGGGKSKRGADRHYPVMSVAGIVKLVASSEPLARVAPSAHAWVWVTDNYLRGGLDVLDACGFRYVRTLCWVKAHADDDGRIGFDGPCTTFDMHRALQVGLGQYLRGSHELCLLGVRGDDMRPAPANRMPSVIFAPRGRHSEKPDAAYDVIEKASPGPRVEMFARAARPGWDVWGNEAP